MNVCRLLFSITILLTYPIECLVCREVIENFVYARWGFLGPKKEEDEVQVTHLTRSLSSFDRMQAWIPHATITFFVVAFTCAISLITDCLGIVLEINVRSIEQILPLFDHSRVCSSPFPWPSSCPASAT